MGYGFKPPGIDSCDEDTFVFSRTRVADFKAGSWTGHKAIDNGKSFVTGPESSNHSGFESDIHLSLSLIVVNNEFLCSL